MIVKIRDIDCKSWWMYDKLTRVHYGSGNLRSDENKIYLKITGESGTENGSQIDNFDVYLNSLYKQPPGKLDEVIDPFLVLIDKKEVKEKINRNIQTYPLNWISFLNYNNDEVLLVFNTKAYILNDDGKTIEKIPAL